MNLVRLEDVQDNENWVNPEFVMAVAVHPDSGLTLIILSDGTKGCVKGTPAEVAAKIMEGAK